jgi:hypothetical protein
MRTSTCIKVGLLACALNLPSLLWSQANSNLPEHSLQPPSVAEFQIVVALTHPIHTKTARPGTVIKTALNGMAFTPDGTKLPKGALVIAHIESVRSFVPDQGSAISLVFDKIVLKSGKAFDIHAQILDFYPVSTDATLDNSSHESKVDVPSGGAPPGPIVQSPGSTSLPSGGMRTGGGLLYQRGLVPDIRVQKDPNSATSGTLVCPTGELRAEKYSLLHLKASISR